MRGGAGRTPAPPPDPRHRHYARRFRVPEGGPDLSASEAREHEDLPFIWWVVDCVMERDRRARWMKHWLLGTTSIQTSEVLERTEPVLYVSHDADDGLWQRCSTYSTSGPAKVLLGRGQTTPGPESPPER
ncbi:hypothetical protein GCM10010435_93370 [Winogradskya consettensis]|uniref:Uncharacterized protein n=1 Tax=Winogradskya consettensis TaxID=113560 RepID=A0A919T376_9ACTN|nr:hypothetical protein Aco04nite_95560 [Actinoplanes consettensis]